MRTVQTALIVGVTAAMLVGSAPAGQGGSVRSLPVHFERLSARVSASPALSRMTPAKNYAGVVTTLPNFTGNASSATFDTDDSHLYILSSGYLERIESNGQTTQIANFFSTGSNTVVWDSNTHVFYVSGPSGYQILQVTPLGVVTLLAGGSQGTKDGQGPAAQFQYPSGMAIDPVSHLLYVADNDRLRTVSESGLVTTVGPAILSGGYFNPSHSVAFDTSTGEVAVTDTPTETVLAFTLSSGKYRPLAGRCIAVVGQTSCPPYQLDGVGRGALFAMPGAITYDPGSNAYYLADGLNFSLRRIRSSGAVTTIAGNGDAQVVDGMGLGASFANPICAALDPQSNQIVVCDSGVMRFSTAHGAIAPPPPHAFTMRPAPTLLSGATGLVQTSDQSLWFAERTPGYIGRRFPSGNIHEYLLPPTHGGPFDPVLGLDGDVRFVDYSNLNQYGVPTQANIARITSSGTVRSTAFPNECNGSVSSPNFLTVDPSADVWFGGSCPSSIGYMTSQGKYTQFVSPPLGGIAIGLGPYVWAASGSMLSKYSLAGTQLATFNVFADGGDAIGPDGHVWFLSNAGQVVGNLDPNSNNVVTYQLPNCNCSRNLGNLTSGPDGALWFTEGGGTAYNPYRGAIGRMTTVGSFTEYPVFEARSEPSGIAFGTNGTVWISDAGADKIGFMR